MTTLARARVRCVDCDQDRIVNRASVEKVVLQRDPDLRQFERELHWVVNDVLMDLHVGRLTYRCGECAFSIARQATEVTVERAR